MVGINAFFIFMDNFKITEARKGKYYKNKKELKMYALSAWIVLDDIKKKFYFEMAKMIIIEEVAKTLGIKQINMPSDGEFYLNQYQTVLSERISSNGRLRSMHESEEYEEEEDRELRKLWFDNSTHDFYYTHAIPLIGSSGRCRLNPAPHWPKELFRNKNTKNT